MTRLWPAGQVLDVVADGREVPRHFIWQSQTHHVAEITRRWRVDEEWWRQRIWRAYFKLSTDTGLLVEIYQDLTTRQWYLQRLYD